MKLRTCHAASMNALIRGLAVIAAMMLAAPVFAQGGFNRDGGTFGDGGPTASDMLIADVNDDDEMDAVVAAAVDGEDHLIYSSIEFEPDAASATALAISRGPTLLVTDVFSAYGYQDIITVDEEGIRLYLGDGLGGYLYSDEYALTGHGAPVFAQAGHFTDPSIKGLVVGYDDIVICFPTVLEEFTESPYYVIEFGNGITSMHTMDLVPGGYHELLVLADGMVKAYELDEEGAQLYGSIDFDDAYLIAPGRADGTKLAVAGSSGLEIHEWDDVEEEFDLLKSADWPVDRQVQQLVAHELTGDSDDDFVVRTPGFTYIFEQTATGFEMYEIIGYPDAGSDCDVVIADVDDDTHDDIVVGRCQSPHGIYYNRNRIEVSIEAAGNGEFEQVVDGQAYAEFTVELDTSPISLVLVYVETDGEEEIEEPGGGEEDGLMDFPDITDIVNAQSGPQYHVPTAQVLAFPPRDNAAVVFCPVETTLRRSGRNSQQPHP